LIIFGANIPDTTCHQMIIQFPISPNVCFCIPWGKHNQWNITFNERKQLLLSARLSHRNSVRPSVYPSVCHTDGSVKNGV